MAFLAKKVLITGGEGFTGQYLKKCLEKDGMVVFSTTHSDKVEAKKSDYFYLDITDKPAVTRMIEKISPDYIIHLAAISFVGHDDASDFYRVNVIGTENLLQAIVDVGLQPEKIILASSANIYGNTSVGAINEDITPVPVNHYACSKMAMERIAINYFDKLNILITRPFNYTGAGQAIHFLVPKIVEHFNLGQREIELGNLDVSRDYSSIYFVVEAYCKLLMSSHKSEIVNICSGNAISLLQIIELMQEISGYKITVNVNPNFVRENEVKFIVGDNKKLFSLIGHINSMTMKELLTEMYISPI